MTEASSTSTSTFPNPISAIRSRLAAQTGSRRALLLMAPLIAFELLIFVIPFAILLRISFAGPSSDGVYADGTWSLEAYREVFATDLIWSIVGYSFRLGLIVTVLSVVIGLFYAYAIWRSSGVVKSLLLFSVVLPLLTTLVIRTYAFDPLLQPAGLLYSNAGVVIAQLYIVLPYAVLAIYSVMATTDWHVVEAARDLGASRPRSVLEVVVPQVMPGIIVAAVVSFAWSVGAYAAPALLSNNITFAIYVERLMLGNMDYPTAAALSAVMLGLMSACIVVIFGVLNRFGGEFELA